MAKTENHSYQISLDVSTPQASKQALKELQNAMKDSATPVSDLNDAYAKLAKYAEDTTELEKQYDKLIAKRLADRDKEIDQLKAEKIAIAANRDLTEEQKKEQIALKDAEIERIEADKKYIRSKAKEIKTEKKLNQLIKEDLKGLKDKVKEQLKFVAALKTTEGRYKAIKKAAQVGTKVGLKAAGGALALGGVAAGMAVGAAQNIADKENALKSLKSGVDPSTVDEIYVKSGADYSSIVAAVNNLSDVTKDNALLVQGAVLELQNPGVGKLLLSTSKQNPENIPRLKNAIDQIKRQTGTQDMSAALEASTKARIVTNGTVSQTDYIQAYAALSQAGLEEDKINRIISDVSRQSGNFIENLNNADLTKYVRGQDKTRLSNIKLGLEKLDLDKVAEKTSAESIVEKLREFELKKNELLVKLLPLIEPMLKELDKVLSGPMIEKIAEGLVNFISKAVPILVTILTKLEPYVDKLIGWIAEIAGANDDKSNESTLGEVAGEKLGKMFSYIAQGLDAILSIKLPGGQKAQGGLVTAPSLVGEAGPELVLPLDYSRAGRASQIINNFNTTQSFNMQSNQTVPLAFSQAIGRNKFVKRSSGI